MNREYTVAAASRLRSKQEELVVVGPPNMLTGTLHIENTSDEAVALQEIPLNRKMIEVTTKKQVERNGSLRLMANLGAGESKIQKVFCSMDPDTTPGTYESEVALGSQKKKLTMIVQNHLSLSLNPGHFVLVGIEPGLKHTVQVQLVNDGNVPVEVPNLRHSTTLDMDFFCRNLSLALRESGDNGSQAFLDCFAKGLKRDMAGWLELSVAEAGDWVEPGASKLLHLTLALPRDIHLEREYTGDIRIYDILLSYIIIASPKKQ
jgi:hypothetical protein